MKRKSRARLYWPLVILIIASIAGVIAIASSSCRYAIALANSPSDIASVDTLLSAGIGIIGIMIAVWTGLSISNVISRKDVDTLNNDIETAKKNMTNIDAYIAENVHIQAELFYVESSRNKWDPLLRYIISKFPPAEEIDEVTNLFSDLTIVELKYSQVKSRHKSKYEYDKNLIDLADEGIQKIEAIKKDRRIHHKSIFNYLNYRKCGFNFFAGYCEKNMELGVKRFISAAQYYERLGNALDVFFKIKSTESEKDYVERRCHLANSIGESYSKIIQYYCDEANDNNMRSHFETEIEGYAKKAIKYCNIAVDANGQLDSHTLSVFYRNRGAAYEGADKLSKLLEQLKEYQDMIIESYEQSIINAEADDSPDPKTIQLAYISYLSFVGDVLFEKRQDKTQENEKLLKALNKYANNADSYFPWSKEIGLQSIRAKCLSMRYYLETASLEQIESIIESIEPFSNSRSSRFDYIIYYNIIRLINEMKGEGQKTKAH